MIVEIFLIIGSYLLGSVCWGYIVAKLLKKDNFGKNDLPGAAGSFRQLGPLFGIAIGFLDAAKGIIPMFVAKSLGMNYPIIILCALAVVAGHNWPIFFWFRGGGGLAPIIGILLCLMPKELAIAMPAAIASGYIYRYTLYRLVKINPNPVGGGVGLLLLPFLAWYFGRPQPLILLTILLLGLVCVRIIHISICRKINKN